MGEIERRMMWYTRAVGRLLNVNIHNNVCFILAVTALTNGLCKAGVPLHIMRGANGGGGRKNKE